MRKKEGNWIWRLSKCTCPPLVKNPADIKEKLIFYGEAENLGKLLRIALYDVHDYHCPDEYKEKSVKNVETFLEEIKIKNSLDNKATKEAIRKKSYRRKRGD